MRGKSLLSTVLPNLRRLVAQTSPGDKIPRIDYPRSGEKVQRGHYAVRISAPAGECHVAIDGGGWHSCRRDAGYFWYDWRPAPGAHHIVVRNRVDNGWGHTETTCEVD
ncbi:MAG: hypothetical protein NTY77_03360 [Elusimicrobia bacterium]|nr:hypothetical protein [Elusimicrobiota bacterium]